MKSSYLVFSAVVLIATSNRAFSLPDNQLKELSSQYWASCLSALDPQLKNNANYMVEVVKGCMKGCVEAGQMFNEQDQPSAERYCAAAKPGGL